MDLIELLQAYQADPAVYLLLFFLYSVAAAIFLPIPVEIGLVLNPGVPFILKALTLGAGKATGSLAVFFIGLKLEPKIRSWSRWKWFRWLLEKSEAFVERYGYLALYTLLSIPGMLDTVPLYIFSILNHEGRVFTKRMWALTNFCAGVNRAILLMILFTAFGIDLFG